MLRPPGPWLLAVSACGWIFLVAGPLALAPPDPQSAAHQHGSHLLHHGWIDWLAMMAAMSPLLLRSEIAWLWRTSLPHRRPVAIATFGIAYAVPWLLLGLLWVSLLASQRLESLALLAALIGLLIWHASPPRQRLLNRCHGRPDMRAFGSGMIADAASFGLRSGLICTGICGPAMLVAMAVPGHLIAMAIVTVIVTIERYVAPRRPAWRLPWSWSDRAPRWRSLTIVAVPAAPIS